MTNSEKYKKVKDAGFAENPPPEAESANDEPKKRNTQAETLLKLADASGADLFQSDMGDLYAAIPVAGHTEILQLESRDFKIWLHGLHYKDTGKAANSDAVAQVLAVLSAKARFDRPEAITLSTRTAERDGITFYDLSNEKWQAIRITAGGWIVCDNPPIMFTRYRHQSAQVTPTPGGDMSRILKYIPLTRYSTLFLCWLVSCFIPNIPHPLVIFYGEKGAAKSTACEFIKAIIDPSSLATLTISNDPRSAAVNLQQHWFLPFDNVSYISDEVSDMFCRAITGGGIQQRKLFTNAEDVIFTFKRIIALNGINNVATRPDLLDRSILIELERITENERRELSEIQAAFESDRAAILGGILDTLSKAMRIYPTVKLPKLQRMADFTRWGYAIGEAFGGLGQTFLDEYAANRDSQNTEAINADPVAVLVVEFMAVRDEWTGRVSSLLRELVDIAADHGVNPRAKSFPNQPNQLSRRLRGIRSNLEAVGIHFENSGHGRQGTIISLNNVKTSSQSSHRHKASNTNAYSRDDDVTINTGNNSSSHSSSRSKPLQHNACDGGDDGDDKNATLWEVTI